MASSGSCKICLHWPTIASNSRCTCVCTHTHTHTHTQQRVWSYTITYCLQRGFGLRGDVLLTVLCNTLSSSHTHLEVTDRVERSESRQGRIWVTPIRKLNSFCLSDNTRDHFTTFTELLIQAFIRPLVETA